MSKPTVAFFGSTGGCTLSTLTRTVQAGIKCSALVRKPSKLTDLLEKRGLTADKLKQHLTVIEGNAKDVEAVKRTILAASTSGEEPADLIVSGIGAAPVYKASLVQPVSLDDPEVCQNAMHTIIEALRSIHRSSPSGSRISKPLILGISTTGISRKQRDVPLAMLPMYHVMLSVPHKDKLVMEEMLESADAERDVICGAIVVRASLLLDGRSKGLDKVRMGWEYMSGRAPTQSPPGPAVGYTIAREDVGLWAFENVVKSPERANLAGRLITLTS